APDVPGPCGCTKLLERDWRWPDEEEDDRMHDKLWLKMRLGAHHSQVWVPEMPPADGPRLADDRAHHEVLATYFGSLSEKHLRAYLDEAAFRWNRRGRPKGADFVPVLEAAADAQPRTYRSIVAKKAPEGHGISFFETRPRPRRPPLSRRSADTFPCS
ncbi:MAG: hypothetical protein ACAI25_20195, partial [Planctomycetota bacterium]